MNSYNAKELLREIVHSRNPIQTCGEYAGYLEQMEECVADRVFIDLYRYVEAKYRSANDKAESLCRKQIQDAENEYSIEFIKANFSCEVELENASEIFRKSLDTARNFDDISFTFRENLKLYELKHAAIAEAYNIRDQRIDAASLRRDLLKFEAHRARMKALSDASRLRDQSIQRLMIEFNVDLAKNPDQCEFLLADLHKTSFGHNKKGIAGFFIWLKTCPLLPFVL